MVTVNGQALVAWTFDYNNVLAWADEAGYSAWLQCLVLPGGPVFVGKITNGDAYEGAILNSVPTDEKTQHQPIAGSGVPVSASMPASGLHERPSEQDCEPPLGILSGEQRVNFVI